VERRVLLQHAARLALVLAAAKIFVLVLARLAGGASGLVSPLTGIAHVIVVFVVMIFAGISARKLATDGQGLLLSRGMFHLWIVFALGNLLFTVFTILLFHVLEPSLIEAVKGPTKEILQRALTANGAEPDQIAKTLAAVDAGDGGYGVLGQLRGWSTSLIIATPGCGILAFLLRRMKPPEGVTIPGFNDEPPPPEESRPPK